MNSKNVDFVSPNAAQLSNCRCYCVSLQASDDPILEYPLMLPIEALDDRVRTLVAVSVLQLLGFTHLPIRDRKQSG